MAEHCPRRVALSAWVDGELAPRAQRDLRAHTEACPVCAAILAELQALHEAFVALPHEELGFDLGTVIEARLRAQPRPALRARPRRLSWLVFPFTSAAAALTLGLYLGGSLIHRPAVELPQQALMLAMSVFDPIPPGHLCPGLQPCSPGKNPR